MARCEHTLLYSANNQLSILFLPNDLIILGKHAMFLRNGIGFRSGHNNLKPIML